MHNTLPAGQDPADRREATVETHQVPASLDDAELRRRQLDERAHRADQRDWVADEREKLADERERLADERDRRASERERLADEREQLADERERLEAEVDREGPNGRVSKPRLTARSPAANVKATRRGRSRKAGSARSCRAAKPGGGTAVVVR